MRAYDLVDGGPVQAVYAQHPNLRRLQQEASKADLRRFGSAIKVLGICFSDKYSARS